MNKFAGSMTVVVLFENGSRCSKELTFDPAKRGDLQRELADYGFHMWEGMEDKIKAAVVIADDVYHYVGSEALEVLGLKG